MIVRQCRVAIRLDRSLEITKKAPEIALRSANNAIRMILAFVIMTVLMSVFLIVVMLAVFFIHFTLPRHLIKSDVGFVGDARIEITFGLDEHEIGHGGAELAENHSKRIAVAPDQFLIRRDLNGIAMFLRK